MHCPFCHAIDTKVIDSRLFDDGAQVRRRRECINCMGRFTTFEKVELSLRVIKRSGLHVLFDPEKLRAGLLKALEKRPVTVEQIDVVMSRILRKIQATGDREISSQLIGEFVMDELRPLDEVAYVRFASVYLSFQHINAFREEIQKYQEWANREKKE